MGRRRPGGPHVAGARTADLAVEELLAEVAERLGAKVIIVGDAHDAVSENAGTIFYTVAHAYDCARHI